MPRGGDALMRLADENSWSSLSYLAAIFAFLLYPLSVAPMGPYSNGGALGLIFIFLALGATWTAFALNRSNPKTRMAIQLPLTALITFLAIREAVTQYQLGPDHWFWF
jgi:predicted membrane-bound spermidine synthase